MRQITLCFAGVMVMAMCVLIMTQLPTRSMVMVHHYVGPDRPDLNLPVASRAMKLDYAGGVIEISLNRKGRWVASGMPFGEEENLVRFLAERAELMRDHGRNPKLRMRIAGDAPARFMRDAAVVAEELGYDRLLLAVYREER